MSIVEFLKNWSKSFDPAATRGVTCTIQLMTSQPVYLSINDGSCTLSEGTAESADLTLSAKDQDLIKMLSGELNPTMAFMTGKLQLDGDLMLAQKMPVYFPQQ